ncbi:nuclease Le1 [Multifurca ochricompacta]|uniref:Nuclease Le1 n=1 Tax=Multifurca ochricompacta TaxID=376703 RepID=A0AAD4QJY5_9AGAM|nr:nuclease Le1 [Multifurca ochricompacta]
MKVALPLALTAAFVAPYGVAAWGTLGHETIGYLAMQFLLPNTLSTVQTTLGSTFSSSLGPASIWADQVRSQTAFKFSAPFHFIDANDSPPTSCSVDLARDCGTGGCVVSAIQNYTIRVQQPSLGATQVQQALLFITHFIGDIGQPLHDEALALGGNTISATCNGASTNLHATWDTGIITANVNALYGGSPQTYASALATRITSGDFSSLAAGWVSNISPSALSSTAVPLTWSQEANALIAPSYSLTTGQDLCVSPYVDNALPVIELQLAKQGYRLATWLNTIFG